MISARVLQPALDLADPPVEIVDQLNTRPDVTEPRLGEIQLREPHLRESGHTIAEIVERTGIPRTSLYRRSGAGETTPGPELSLTLKPTSRRRLCFETRVFREHATPLLPSVGNGTQPLAYRQAALDLPVDFQPVLVPVVKRAQTDEPPTFAQNLRLGEGT